MLLETFIRKSLGMKAHTVVQVGEQPDGGATARGRNQFAISYMVSQGGDHG
jgi:hypothetical protein